MGDLFTWNAVTGDWGTAANWIDVTASEDPASQAPGSADSVTIGVSGGSATEVITGTGSAASITTEQTTILEGTFDAGSLHVASGNLTVNAGDSLTLTGNASLSQYGSVTTIDGTLSAGSVTMGSSLFAVGSGGNVDISGNFADGSNYNNNQNFEVTGGSFTAASLTQTNNSGGAIVSGDGSLTIAGDVTDNDQTYGRNTYQIESGSTFTVGGTFVSSGDSVYATGSSHVQLAAVTMQSSGEQVYLQADGTSSIEIGTAGGAAAGSITIDTGASTTMGGSLTATTIVDDGTLAVQASNNLTLSGSLTGDGQVQIGSNAVLSVSAVSAASTNTVDFAGNGGVLKIGSGALNGSLAFAPAIGGFNGSDVIDYNGTVTSAAFSGGVLTLSNGGTTVATLSLTGSYAGDTFSTVAVTGGNTQIAVLGGGDTGIAPTGTGSADSYTWGVVAGSWDVASNWNDTTASQTPASLAPGSLDNVTIGVSGGGATELVTGTGDAASITTEQTTILEGTFDAGSLHVASGNLTVNAGDSLTLTGNASLSQYGSVTTIDGTLSAGSMTMGSSLFAVGSGGNVDISGNFADGSNYNNNQNFEVTGGSFTAASLTQTNNNGGAIVSGDGSLTIAGDVTDNDQTYGRNTYQIESGSTFTVGGTFVSSGDSVYATGSSHVQLAAVTMQSSGEQVYLQADGTSSIEIGTAGGAAAGSITIDTGASTTMGGSLTATTIVDDGTLAVQASNNLTLSGSLTGDGQVQIGSNAVLSVSAVSAASTNTVDFAGNGGVLKIGSGALNGSLAFAPAIGGFNGSDVIDYNGTVTSAAFSGGVLTLSNGGTTVATLSLTGSYAGDTFSTVAVTGGNTQIAVLGGGDTGIAPTGTGSADSYTWGVVAGSWDVASNWNDTTASQTPASLAPGSLDNVTIGVSGGGATELVTGTGDAASITTEQTTILEGTFDAGSLHVANGNLTVATGDSLTLTGNASLSQYGSVTTIDGTLSAGSVTMGGSVLGVTGTVDISGNFADGSNYNNNQNFEVTGGSFTAASLTQTNNNGGAIVSGDGSLTIAGDVTDNDQTYGRNTYQIESGSTFTVGGTFVSSGDSVYATGSSHVQLAAVTMQSSGEQVYLQADGTSSIEIGTAGGAAAGSITDDAGVTTVLGGSLTATDIVVNGTLAVQANNNLTLSGSLAGDGQVQIGGTAVLTVSGVDSASTNTIAFTGTDGVLKIGAASLNGSLAFLPGIAGLTATDAIDYSGTVTSATYSGGILTLSNGGSTVATITLNGDYNGETFYTQSISGGTQISLSQQSGDTPPVITSPASQTVFDAVSSTVSGVSIADSTSGASLSVALTAAQGALYANTLATDGGGTITGSGTRDLTISGTLAQINADLSTLAYFGSVAGSDTILVSANDGLGGISDSQISLDVDAAPVISAAIATAISGADLTVAHTAMLYIGFSKDVTVAAGTTLTLSDGETATYASGSGTGSLAFTYSTTNLPSSTLKVVSSSSPIEDAAGNPVAITGGGVAVASYTDAVVDTAAHVAAQIDNLEASISHISSITLNDGGTPTVTIDEAQYTADSAVLAKIQGPYDLHVSDAAGTSPQAGGSSSAPSYTGVDYIYNASNTLTETIYHDSDGTVTAVGNATGETINDSASTSNDYFDLSNAADVTVTGGSGNDGFYFGANFSASDTVNGGSGTNNQIGLKGDYSHGLTLGADTITNIQVVALLSGFSYNLTLNAGNLSAGHTLTIWAADLASADTLTLNASAVTAGNLVIYGGAGADTIVGGGSHDTIYGGGGADTITGGSGTNVFAYTGVSNSTSTGYDTITNFDALTDVFQFKTDVTAIDAAVTSGQLDTGSNFDTELAAALNSSVLGADHAILFTPNSGTLAGHTFLVVDANNVAGYTAGADYVFDITGATHLASLSTSDFII